MKKTSILKYFVLLKKVKPVHYLVIAGIIALGVFNAVTAVMPQVKQNRYERGIEKSFNKWWEEEGANQFKVVGIEPDEKIRQEEFEQFRNRAFDLKPSYIIEDRVELMKKDFREWWEIRGGKEEFTAKNNRYPSESDFRHELAQWIDNYTDKFARYNMAFVPKKEQYDRLLTSWILFPSIWNYVLFAVLFVFALVHLEKRWQWFILWGCIVGWTLGGGVLVSILTGTSFFDHYSGERYMGMSLTIAFLLGATAFAPRKDMVSQLTSAVCFTGLVLDMAVNWFANPNIFGAVTVLSPVAFGAGAIAGLKIETRRKTRYELKQEALQQRARRIESRNPMAEMKNKTRVMIQSGIENAKGGRPEQALSLLTQSMVQLLQEHPIDKAAVLSLADSMNKLYIEVSSNQWLEWGELAKNKNAPEAAIMLLEKGLSLEKDKNFARRALYTLGETCVIREIDVEEGLKHLRKVIEMNKTDILAKQAQKILDSYKALTDSSSNGD